jgi:hypothetical protein
MGPAGQSIVLDRNHNKCERDNVSIHVGNVRIMPGELLPGVRVLASAVWAMDDLAASPSETSPQVSA